MTKGNSKQNKSAKSAKKPTKRGAKRKNNQTAAPNGAMVYGGQYVDHPTTRDFYNSLCFPDVTGPIRVPRNGAAQRTGLGVDRSYATQGNTGLFNLIKLNVSYNTNSATAYAAANATTAWGSPFSIAVGAQFPASASIADVNLTAACLLVSYTGAPLSATGELLIGTMPTVNSVTSATFNSLSYYPGVLKIPISSLIDKPLRVSLRKISPEANHFISTSSSLPDTEDPFVAFTTTAANNVVTVQVIRNWEYRSTIDSSYVIPYEKATGTFHEDVDAFEDAQGLISETETNVSEGYPEYLREMILGGIGNMATNYLSQGTSGLVVAAQMLANRHLNRLRDRV